AQPATMRWSVGEDDKEAEDCIRSIFLELHLDCTEEVSGIGTVPYCAVVRETTTYGEMTMLRARPYASTIVSEGRAGQREKRCTAKDCEDGPHKTSVPRTPRRCTS